MGDLRIVRYQHQEPGLFLWLGPFLCSRQVVKEFGGVPIYSDAGTTWLLGFDGEQLVGFCAVKDTPQAYWIDYSYVIPERRQQGIHGQLAAARVALLASLPPKPVRVCCRERRWPYYEGQGFTLTSRRGSWVYGEKAVSL